MTTTKTQTIRELTAEEMKQAGGGGLLLPAVQSAQAVLSCRKAGGDGTP
jgi:hypothetical protein